MQVQCTVLMSCFKQNGMYAEWASRMGQPTKHYSAKQTIFSYKFTLSQYRVGLYIFRYMVLAYTNKKFNIYY